jgi:two-component system cell cycle response regulator CtrA
MRILLIEDDRTAAKNLETILKAEGHVVEAVDTGEEAIDLAKLYDYDVLLLELELPDMLATEVLRTIRLEKVRAPVIVLSGRKDVDALVRCLNFGADDFVAKPFANEELLARLGAVVRRSKGLSESVVVTGEIVVNLDTKTVEVAGNRVYLTSKEYAIMELLSLRKNVTLTKNHFLDHLYGGMDEPELKIVDVFICKLRKKLRAANCKDDCIETVWGRGYVLRDPQQAKVGVSTAA